MKNVFDVNSGIYANTKLYANEVAIAEINDNIIKYLDNATAQDILNAYAHDDAESLTALIGITTSSACDVVLSLTDNVYPARFQRPVDIVGVEGKIFTDAEANGSVIDIMDLFKFNDWRDVKFIGDNGELTDAWLFGYYKFTKAKADIKGIITTLGMGENATREDLDKGELLSNINTQVNFVQIDNKEFSINTPTAANYQAIYNKVKDGFGKIQYNNNNNNVKQFWVRIPVEFSYDWGTIRAYVDCQVNHTMGN